MSNVYSNRVLFTIARNTDNTISVCGAWYSNTPIEWVVFSPLPNGRIDLKRFDHRIDAMKLFEELTKEHST